MSDAVEKKPIPPRAKKMMIGMGIAVLVIVFVAFTSQRRTVPEIPEEAKGVHLSQIDGVPTKTDALDTPEMRKAEIDADNRRAAQLQKQKQTSVAPVDSIVQSDQTPGVGVAGFDVPLESSSQNIQTPNPQYKLVQPVQQPAGFMTEQEKQALENMKMAFAEKLENLSRNDGVASGAMMMTLGNGRIDIGIPSLPDQPQIPDQKAPKDTKPAKPIIRAGTSYAASIDISSDSEYPGVMKATLLSGPYVGAVVLGTVNASKSGDRIGISFSKGVFDKKTVSINAVALSVDGKSTDVSTSVDRKYLERFLLRPIGAASAVVADMLKQPNSSIFVNGNGVVTQSSTTRSGADVARAALATAMQEVTKTTDAATTPVAKIDATEKSGKIILVMFLDDVVL